MADIRLFDDLEELGRQAAICGGEAIRDAISRQGHAFIVLATGSSQFKVLEYLVAMSDIDWSCVTAFHLDEYIGLSRDHQASFRRYLQERFVIPLQAKALLHEIDGEQDPEKEVTRLNQLIADKDIAVAFAGIGDNCHLAFNDPPADFETTAPYLVVELDEACRQQQVRGGWFDDLTHVPSHAISMSIQQIMKAQTIILSATGVRKQQALRHALKGKVDCHYPASILQSHHNSIYFLDSIAAADLS